MAKIRVAFVAALALIMAGCGVAPTPGSYYRNGYYQHGYNYYQGVCGGYHHRHYCGWRSH